MSSALDLVKDSFHRLAEASLRFGGYLSHTTLCQFCYAIGVSVLFFDTLRDALDPESLSADMPEPDLAPLHTRRMLTPSPGANSDILVLVSLRALSEYRALHHT